MGKKYALFTEVQIDALDAKQRRSLRNAIAREIRNSREVRRILKPKLVPVYNRLKAGR